MTVFFKVKHLFLPNYFYFLKNRNKLLELDWGPTNIHAFKGPLQLPEIAIKFLGASIIFYTKPPWFFLVLSGDYVTLPIKEPLF